MLVQFENTQLYSVLLYGCNYYYVSIIIIVVVMVS